ncbi:hypothetical protein SAMN04489761_4118 [Tenacibaculum sp. MAR_2009_124]|uniref:hypothetical protein n=1 Tax=Tenacibaculum sp. MAR_2009_124 TaxID=1250059 RepID=UPI00089D974A|nr:hypothetical protein [Tenacibaculum sp. MAR_2009_124]SED05409.1 hypothetical protein SAMN04489761_4118 [Tenacibaculum sp. MAR_2009_124]
MREENVTKNILKWLQNNKWEIVCFDFPQSGTGVLLHLNNTNRTEKNKGGIIPDIIAVRNGIAVFFENKDRFYQPDFDKLVEIKTKLNYSDSLELLLSDYNISSIFYGIGVSDIKKEVDKCKLEINEIDFLISTNKKKEVIIHYDSNTIFSNA